MRPRRISARRPAPRGTWARRRLTPVPRSRPSKLRSSTLRSSTLRPSKLRPSKSRPSTLRPSKLRPSTLRRALLVAVLLAVLVFPLPGLASGSAPQQTTCQGQGCRAQAAVERWAVRLPGAWTAGTGPQSTGDGGTVPAVGQAYVAVGGGVAVLGAGLSLTGYRLDGGTRMWQLTLDAPADSAIMSVRAWQGVVTVGLLAPTGQSRTEVVVDASTGVELRRYPAAVLGGAVAASAATTVVIGRATLTSYANATGRIRWQHKTAAGQSWQADGQTLYVPQSRGGSLGSSPVTALRVIDLTTGEERTLASPLGNPFSGTLAIAADGVVLFASPSGVTAYSGSTGGELWTMGAAVPEGTDPAARLVYLTSSGALTGVDPLTGTVRAAVSGSAAAGSAGMYVVRSGVALGLDSGANGEAWGYSVAAGRVTWTSPLLPWPHYFSDLSGLGGSAAGSGDVVAVTACPHLAAAGRCADPELVSFTL